MAMQSINSSFDISLMRNYRHLIEDICRNQNGDKVILYDSALALHFESILSKDKPADLVLLNQIDLCDPNELKKDVVDSVLYFLRPTAHVIKTICIHIARLRSIGIKSDIHIYFAPHRTVLCDQLLKDCGIFSTVTLHIIDLHFTLLDKDLYTLHSFDWTNVVNLQADATYLNVVAHGLLKFQKNSSYATNVKAIGSHAKMVLEEMCHLRCQQDDDDDSIQTSSSSSSSVSYNQRKESINNKDIINITDKEGDEIIDKTGLLIDTLIIMDREIDLFSLFVTPLHYEGLIDQVINVQPNLTIRVPPHVFAEEETKASNTTSSSTCAVSGSSTVTSPTMTTTKKVSNQIVTMKLTTDDEIYTYIRNFNIQKLGEYLKQKSLEIKTIYTTFKDNKSSSSISDIHSFMYQKLPQVQQNYAYLNKHLTLAAYVNQNTNTREYQNIWRLERSILEGDNCIDQIDDYISADIECRYIYTMLKLLCLQSLCSGGIRTAKLNTIKRTIVHVYGFIHASTIYHLEQLGLIKRKETLFEGVSLWSTLKKSMNLLQDPNTVRTTGAIGDTPTLTAADRKQIKSEIGPDKNELYDNIMELLMSVSSGYIPLSIKVMLSVLFKISSTVKSTSSALTSTTSSSSSFLSELILITPSIDITMDMLRQVIPYSYSSSQSMTGISTTVSSSTTTSISTSTATVLSSSYLCEVTQDKDKAYELVDLLSKKVGQDINIGTKSSTVTPNIIHADTPLSAEIKSSTLITDSPISKSKPVLILCMVGGITLMEIAMCRILSNSISFPYTIIIVTTHVIHSHDYFHNMCKTL